MDGCERVLEVQTFPPLRQGSTTCTSRGLGSPTIERSCFLQLSSICDLAAHTCCVVYG